MIPLTLRIPQTENMRNKEVLRRIENTEIAANNQKETTEKLGEFNNHIVY